MKYARVELHLHLDGSLNIEWAYNKAIERGVVDKTTTFSEFYKIINPLPNAYDSDMFKKFDIVNGTLQTKQDLYEATYNLVKHLDSLGLIYAEIRFASQLHTLKSMSQYDALQTVIEASNKAQSECDIKIGIINAMMHRGDSAAFNYEENLETIEVSKKFLNKGLVAVDIAGFENNCNFLDYAPLFKLASNYNIPYTIHAGEMGNPNHIIDAINMGAKRIGHGINCVMNKDILKEVVDRQIPLEVCPTSNVEPAYDYASHPIRQLIEAGVKVTINSDNIMFSRTNIINEYCLMELIGIDEIVLKKCTLNAIDAAFTTDEIKKELRDKLIF